MHILWLFIVLPAILLCRADSSQSSGTADFAICLVVKDYNEYIVEWLEYHRRMGCGRFYIYDHGSETPMLLVIKDYVLSGLVEYTYTDFRLWGSHGRPYQIQAYDKCLKEFGPRHRWMGFIDSDEFIVVVNKTQTIPDVLRGYEGYGGVGLTWMVFGSSNHIFKPPGGVLPNYHKCAPNRLIKTIVNPAFASHADRDPHHFAYIGDKFTVSTSYAKLTEPYNQDFSKAYDVMYINHYHTKSMEDFIGKLRRGRGITHSKLLTLNYFHNTDALCVNNCTVLEMPPPIPSLR
jgi:hypothetical protein